MKNELPQLPYELDALAPFMSKETLLYHWGKHHQTYVNNLNQLSEGTPFAGQPLEVIIKSSQGAVFNNASQSYNHTLFFLQLSPSAQKEPKGVLAEAIARDFGSMESFKEQFTKAAVTTFGSGWAWLCRDNKGKLSITQESNAGNPITQVLKPIMTCDVWEHAYYIDYKNMRADFVKTFWEILDWGVVGRRYNEEGDL